MVAPVETDEERRRRLWLEGRTASPVVAPTPVLVPGGTDNGEENRRRQFLEPRRSLPSRPPLEQPVLVSSPAAPSQVLSPTPAAVSTEKPGILGHLLGPFAPGGGGIEEARSVIGRVIGQVGKATEQGLAAALVAPALGIHKIIPGESKGERRYAELRAQGKSAMEAFTIIRNEQTSLPERIIQDIAITSALPGAGVTSMGLKGAGAGLVERAALRPQGFGTAGQVLMGRSVEAAGQALTPLAEAERLAGEAIALPFRGAARGIGALRPRASTGQPARNIAEPASGGPMAGGREAELLPTGRAVGQPGDDLNAAPPQTAPSVSPGTASGGRFAGNIRLSKYPEDVRGVIKEWADIHPAEMQVARRGTRTDAQVLEDAQAITEDMGGDFAKVQKHWKPGQAWNAEETLAIRGTLRTKTEDVLQAAKAAVADNSVVNHTKLLLAMEEQANVQSIVHGVTAEAGRSLRSFRQEAFNAIQANDTQKLQELLRRVGRGADLDTLAAAITHLDINNPVAVNEFLRNASKPKLWDYMMELYMNSILSGPKTHIINELSNTVNAMASPIERGTAALIDMPLSRLQGRVQARFMAEVPEDIFGALEGIGEGVRAGLSTLRNGITPAAASKWEFRRGAFRGLFGRIVRGPGTALEAADATNFVVNYRAALGALTLRQARIEGLGGAAALERIATLRSAPTEALIKEASQTAEYRLFRQEPGEFTSWLMRGRDIKVFGGEPLRVVIPFLRTPVNLLKFGIERSPIGVVNPELWRNLAIKNPEAADQIARIFLGSAIAAATASYFAKGKITGAAPTERAARDRFYREGKLPFALQVGDRWVQYQRLEPFNQPLMQVASAVQAIETNDKSAEEKVALAIFYLSQNLVSQTYLSGLSDVLNMVNQPERYGTNYLTRLAAASVPASALLRTAAQTIDPTFRRPTNFPEQVQAGLPGLSQNVPSVLTAFGEEARRESPAISPIQVTGAHQSEVDAELGRLGIEVGFVGKAIGGKVLTADAQRRYQVEAGRRTYADLVRLVASSSYRTVRDVEKEKAIDTVVRRARDAVRDEMARNPKNFELQPAGAR